MKIRSFFSLENNVYRAVIRTEDWSERDVKLMEKFGEPEIDVGGTFGEYESAFDLPGDYRRIHSESPFAQGFDTRDFDDADERVDVWAAAVVARIRDAVTALRQLDGEYGREEVVTV